MISQRGFRIISKLTLWNDQQNSALQSLTEAQKTVPNLSLATIYRNIKGLISDGVVDVVSLPGETDRYEMHKHHHHHFHCNSCHQVTDIDACPGDLASLMPSGYLLEAHELTLYGRCPDCASAGVRPQDKAGRST
ncbi:MAG: transcriptional repressor [Betaproteobacteria bacterium]|nr:transcriptional repressor [Betaproteobacteria bacterium]